jgi:hypothetical protein
LRTIELGVKNLSHGATAVPQTAEKQRFHAALALRGPHKKHYADSENALALGITIISFKKIASFDRRAVLTKWRCREIASEPDSSALRNKNNLVGVCTKRFTAIARAPEGAFSCEA